jgi:hypothetical protein
MFFSSDGGFGQMKQSSGRKRRVPGRKIRAGSLLTENFVTKTNSALIQPELEFSVRSTSKTA